MPRKAARKAVSALAAAAGGGAGAEKLAKKALANLRPTPERSQADLFVALRVKGKPFVRSCWTTLEDSFARFFAAASEWAWVELHWWCDDHGIPKEPTAERDAVIAAIRPALFSLDLAAGALEAVNDDAAYQKVRRRKPRRGRQFVFLDTEAPAGELLPALARAVRGVHGKAAPAGLAVAALRRR